MIFCLLENKKAIATLEKLEYAKKKNINTVAQIHNKNTQQLEKGIIPSFFFFFFFASFLIFYFFFLLLLSDQVSEVG